MSHSLHGLDYCRRMYMPHKIFLRISRVRIFAMQFRTPSVRKSSSLSWRKSCGATSTNITKQQVCFVLKLSLLFNLHPTPRNRAALMCAYAWVFSGASFVQEESQHAPGPSRGSAPEEALVAPRPPSPRLQVVYACARCDKGRV